ncbi:hypothetical protein M885DRAFT_586925 [Pelagophyceae sp. CCMP2097]|nr:hypothetical protein M885DRAFT_586925 [Pelagophyceae sp. CCMP2097]
MASRADKVVASRADKVVEAIACGRCDVCAVPAELWRDLYDKHALEAARLRRGADEGGAAEDGAAGSRELSMLPSSLQDWYAVRDAHGELAARAARLAEARAAATAAAAAVLRNGLDADAARRAAAAAAGSDADADERDDAGAQRAFERHVGLLVALLLRAAPPPPRAAAVDGGRSATKKLPAKPRKKAPPRAKRFTAAELAEIGAANGLELARVGGGYSFSFRDRQALIKTMRARARDSAAAEASEGSAALSAVIVQRWWRALPQEARQRRRRAAEPEDGAEAHTDGTPAPIQVARLFGVSAAVAHALFARFAVDATRQSLDLRGEPFSHGSLAAVLSTHEHLVDVDLTTPGTDAPLDSLELLRPRLLRLKLGGWRHVSGAAFLVFFDRGLPRLEQLGLAECCAVGDDAVSALWDHAPNLVDLCAYGCFLLTPRCLRGLHKEHALSRINVSGAYKLKGDFQALLFHSRPYCAIYTDPL